MFKFPQTFAENYENYITVPILKEFCKEKSFKVSENRENLIRTIEEYANEAQENEEEVKTWVDKVLRAGIKDVYIRKIKIEDEQKRLLLNAEYVMSILGKHIYDSKNKHIISEYYGENVPLVKYDFDLEKQRICLYFVRRIHSMDNSKNQKEDKALKSVIYPMIVDIFINEEIVVARGKTKTSIYKYMGENFDIAQSKRYSTTVEKELRDISTVATDLFDIMLLKQYAVQKFFKNKIYCLLESYTATPPEINKLLEENKERIYSLTSEIIQICNNKVQIDKVNWDVRNTVEKYFSINFEDTKIFTRGRDAFPLRLSATDEDDSTISQRAGNSQPLQSRDVFFDNKRMLQRSRSCDGVTFVFARRHKESYFKDNYNVSIMAKQEYCLVKFMSYTKEEDMDYVLFSIVAAGADD